MNKGLKSQKSTWTKKSRKHKEVKEIIDMVSGEKKLLPTNKKEKKEQLLKTG